MSINRKEITKEMLAKAVQCRNADELIALAKTPKRIWRSWPTLSLTPTRCKM